MNLSDAIIKGAALRPQAIGSLVGVPFAGRAAVADIPATCVFGAALEGVGLLTITGSNGVYQFKLGRGPFDGALAAHWANDLNDTFPILDMPVAWRDLPCGCPEGTKLFSGHIEGDLRVHGVLMHLNDFHRWRREMIAKWVKRMERK